MKKEISLHHLKLEWNVSKLCWIKTWFTLCFFEYSTLNPGYKQHESEPKEHLPHLSSILSGTRYPRHGKSSEWGRSPPDTGYEARKEGFIPALYICTSTCMFLFVSCNIRNISIGRCVAFKYILLDSPMCCILQYVFVCFFLLQAANRIRIHCTGILLGRTCVRWQLKALSSSVSPYFCNTSFSYASGRIMTPFSRDTSSGHCWITTFNFLSNGCLA